MSPPQVSTREQTRAKAQDTKRSMPQPCAIGACHHAVRAVEQPPCRLGWGAVWIVVGRLLGVGVTMLINVVLARWLSHDDYGSYLLLTSLLALASLLGMLGLGPALARFVGEGLGHRDNDRARQSVRLVLSIAPVSIAGVAIVVAVVLLRFHPSTLGLPAGPWIVPIVIATLILLAALQLLGEASRSLHDMRLATLLSGGQTGGLLSNTVFLVFISALAWIGAPDLRTALALNALAMVIILPAAVWGFFRTARTCLGPPAARPTATKLAMRPLLSFSISMLAVQLLTLTTTQADLWIAGVACHHDQVALYGSARRLMLLVSLPVQMLNLTVIASIAELHVQRRLGDLERLLRRSAALAALPSAAAIVVLIVWADPVLELLFGPFFCAAALPLTILAVGQLFLVAAGSCGCALEMSGNHVVVLLVNLVAAVAVVAVGTWAARQFGILGLAVASAGVIAAQSITLWLLAKRIVGVWTHPTLRVFHPGVESYSRV